MKIDRLIGILSILLQKETETIPSLARQFEVSPRTISRDIETLCQAGIPINRYTYNERGHLYYGRLQDRPHAADFC